MKFCPKCEIRLKSHDSKLVCPKCGHSEGGDSQSFKTVMEEKEVSELNVLEESDGKEALPTIKINCEKCDHDEAVWWMLQTRSADEPTTQFYRCINCGHTWRNYA